MRGMRALWVSVSVLAAMPAGAAEVPAMVGLWTAVETAGSTFTIAPMDQMAKPVDGAVLATRPSGETWDIRIDAQDGRALAGALVSRGGKEQVALGALRLDGKRLVIASDFTAGEGDVAGETMELCWVDLIPNYIATSCTTYRRAAPGSRAR